MRAPHSVYVLAGILAMAALWPIHIAGNWIGGDFAIAKRMLRGDSMGFSIFPDLLMFARPTLAMLGALAGPFASYLVIRSAPAEAFGILAKAAVAQGAVAAVLYITERSTNGVLGWMLLAFENPRRADAIRSVDVIALQTASAGSFLLPLIVVAFCYGIGALLAEYIRPRSVASEQVAAAESGRYEALPPALNIAVLNAPAQPPTSVSSAFKQTSYEVRPNLGRLVAFNKWNNDYEIRAATFARSNQENYSFSMANGTLQGEPGGGTLLTVQYTTDQTFDVLDGGSNVVSRVLLRKPGCEIQDRLGRAIVSVDRFDNGPGRALYRATAGGKEICRYTWSSGAGPLNPLLLVDFESGTEFDRGLAIVVAPFLEEEARLESEKYFRYQG
jgi:hypothetical protein